MKKQHLRLIVLIVVVVLVQLACGLPKISSPVTPQAATVEPTSVPPQVATVEPTTVPPQVATVEPTPVLPQATIVAPTESLPTSVPPVEKTEPSHPQVEEAAFFTEKYYTLPTNWTYWVQDEDTMEGVDLYVEDHERLVVEISKQFTIFHGTLDDYLYRGVYIETGFIRSETPSNVGLVCNYMEDEGWLEIVIDNDGHWIMYAFIDYTDSYYKLAEGNSPNLKPGSVSNVLGMACVNNEISLYVNGQLEQTYIDETHAFEGGGKVGLTVTDLKLGPVFVKFDYFKIEDR